MISKVIKFLSLPFLKKENLIFHLWQPTPKKLLRIFKALNIEVIDKSFSADAYHSFYLVGKVKHD